MPVAVKFRPGVDQHVFGEADSAQTSLSALHPADGAFVAGRHNDHQVHIAVFGGRAPGVRAEQPDLLRLKFRFQSFNRFFQKAGLNCIHDAKTNSMAVDLKARVWSIGRGRPMRQAGRPRYPFAFSEFFCSEFDPCSSVLFRGFSVI